MAKFSIHGGKSGNRTSWISVGGNEHTVYKDVQGRRCVNYGGKTHYVHSHPNPSMEHIVIPDNRIKKIKK